jgi:hypothetical protein
MTTTTNQAAWQEDYQQKQREIERQKRAYFDADETLVLPRHSRYYYDWMCSQYNSYPMENKLKDLGFLVTNGFNLKRSIRDYKKEREEYITSAIPQTFIFYIIYMRFSEYHHFTELVLRKLSESKLISLFIDEVTMRYDPAHLEVKLGGWKDEELLEGAKGDKETFFRLVTTTEWTKITIND